MPVQSPAHSRVLNQQSVLNGRENNINMPLFDKRMENKLEDLVGCVEYLKDQNISLMKHLDQTRQICETQQEEIMNLSMFLNILEISSF